MTKRHRPFKHVKRHQTPPPNTPSHQIPSSRVLRKHGPESSDSSYMFFKGSSHSNSPCTTKLNWSGHKTAINYQIDGFSDVSVAGSLFDCLKWRWAVPGPVRWPLVNSGVDQHLFQGINGIPGWISLHLSYTKVKVDTQLIRERKAPSTFIREDVLQFMDYIPFKFLHTDSLIHLQNFQLHHPVNVPTKYRPSIIKGICQVPTSNP